MKHNFLNKSWRFFLATLMLLSTFGIGNAWGVDLPYFSAIAANSTTKTPLVNVSAATAAGGVASVTVTKSTQDAAYVTFTLAADVKTVFNNTASSIYLCFKTDKDIQMSLCRSSNANLKVVASYDGSTVTEVESPVIMSSADNYFSFEANTIYYISTTSSTGNSFGAVRAYFKAMEANTNVTVYGWWEEELPSGDSGDSDPVSVTGVSLNKTATTITVGGKETLTATVAPADATTKTISWTSNNESVATVVNGVVTAVAAGSATITVTTTDGDFTATCDVTVEEAPKSDKCQLISAKYSNGFYGAITEPASPANGSVEVRYLQETTAPTLTSVEVSPSATYVDNGTTIVVTAEDGTTTATYDVNIAAVTPLDVTADVATTTFSEVPAWIYNLYGYDGSKGVKFAKKLNEESNMRISKGNTRQYYFIGAAQTLTLTSGSGGNRNINVYRNGVKLSTPTATGAANATIDIALDPAAACMITIESNQTGGDGGFTKYAIKANPSAGSHNITYTNLKGADNSANPTSFEEGAGVASFTALADVTGYTFAGWSPASISAEATTDQTIEATWIPVNYTITYEGLEGATHSNPATYTIEDEIVFADPSARAGYTFTGWTPASIAAGSHENKTVTAGWEAAEPAGLIKLVNGTELNTEKFHTTITLSSASYVVDGKTYTKYLKFGGTFTTPKDSYQPNKFVRFDMTKKSAMVKAYAYNKASSAKKFYVAVVEEDDAEGDIDIRSIDVPATSGAILSADFTVAKNASIYFLTGDNSNLFLCQASVLESGEALPVPCKPGYSINFVNPRFSLDENSGKTGSFDGFEMNSNAALKVLNAANGVDTKTAETHYIKFTLTERTKVNVTATVPSGRAYSINGAKAYDAEVNSFTSSASVDLNAGTWYINPDAGTSTYIKKIAFAEPSAVYTVTFNTNGGSSVDAQEVTEGGKVTEPADPTKTDYDFVEWCADEELTTPFDFENTTISAATTIYAKWTAHVTSSDATLASLTVNGNDILDGDEVEYTIYAETIPTVVATKNNEFATVTPTEAVAVPGTSTYLVTAESGATKTYTIHFDVPANACGTLISANLTSNTAATVTGVLGGTADVNVTSGTYKMDKGKYIGVTLAAGSFRAGDIVTINVTDNQNATGFCLYSAKDGASEDANLIIDTRAAEVIDNGEYDIVLPEDYAGGTTIYVLRFSSSTTGNLNACVNSVKVTRDCNPQITDFEVAGVHATINHSAETITAELPFGTSLASLTPTVTLGNGGTAYTPDGAQDFTSPVAYTVTGTNGTRTYAVTLTVESHDPAMEITSANGTITLSGLSPRTKNVTTTLSGEYLTAGTYDVTVSAVVEGLSIAPAQFTVAEDGSLANTEFTITYASDADVAEANVTFTFSDGTTSKVYTLTYSSEAVPELLPLLDVEDDMTFNFVGAVDAQVNGVNDGQYYVLENYAVKPALNGQYIAADFNKITTGSLQGKGLKFHTTVPGTVTVEFSNTGTKDNYRELYINGVATGAKSKTTGHVTYTQAVEAGDVVLTAFEETATWNMLNFYNVTFTAATQIRSGLTVGDFGTMCQAKPIATLSGAIVYEIEKPNAIGLDLVEAEFPLVAGKPYIYQATAETVSVIYGEGEAATGAVAANGLVGRLSTAEGIDYVPADMYVIQLNNLRKVAADNSIKFLADRAYINYDAVEENAVEDDPQAAPRRRVTMGGVSADVVTSIDEISAETGATKFIENGILYIRRGGKVYSAQGQLVK